MLAISLLSPSPGGGGVGQWKPKYLLIVLPLDKEILIQVCGQTVLHELILYDLLGTFMLLFTENSLK